MLNENIRIDLHIHSSESAYKEEKGLVKDSDAQHSDVLLGALETYGIDMFSITDHNRFNKDLYEHLDMALSDPTRKHRPTLLAGVEFDVRFEKEADKTHPAAHVIAIFNANGTEDYGRIQMALADHKILGKGDSYDLGTFETVLKEIHLDTILVAHQFSGLNGTQRKRSLGKATDDPVGYYKYGYIDAFEYNSPTVQSILRSELRNLSLPQRMLIGSDCHVWQFYPRHDPSKPMPEAFCATIRALPTFKGLLLALSSPTTRIGCIPYEMREGYCPSVSLCGREVALSPGLNAIIGENGSGKSSMLQLLCLERRHVKTWAKQTGKRLAFSCSHHLSGLVFIQQNELQEKYHNDSLFDASLFQTPDHTQFETAARAFTDKVKERIRQNIRLASLRKMADETTFSINPEMEGAASALTARIDDDFANIGNPWSAAEGRLAGIASKIEAEESRNDIYWAEEIDKLVAARRLISEVRESVQSKGAERSADLAARGVVLNALKRYANEVEARSSDGERLRSAYQESKSRLVSTVVELAKADGEVPIEPMPAKLEGLAGTAGVQHNGFTFVRTAAYCDTPFHESFLEEFNSAYQDLDKICTLDTEAKVLKAIPRAKGTSWEAAFDALVDGFIARMEETTETILDSNKVQSGNTMGEKAITYFKYQSVNIKGATVFVVDQPEDNISNKRISNTLNEYLNDLRKRAQVIIVTHNPLLVVNLDADNVIALTSDGSGTGVTYGCLESEDNGVVLEAVADIMDGGKEAVERRLRAYGSLR